MKQECLFAHTENTYPLPAFVNLSKDGEGYALLVRSRGEDYPSRIELTREEVQRLIQEAAKSLSE